jgi:DNA invertase Pin-like site-specific DNA recombinase
MKLVGYTRVSTAKQADHGSSLSEQQHSIKTYCAHGKHELVNVLSDRAISGAVRLADRPAGREVCRMLEEGEADGVVVVRLDRAFRDTVDAITQVKTWNAADVGIHVLDLGGMTIDTSTPLGFVFVALMSAFAEMEHMHIGERNRARIRGMWRQGKSQHKGNPGVGMEIDPGDPEQRRLRPGKEWRSLLKLLAMCDVGALPEEAALMARCNGLEKLDGNIVDERLFSDVAKRHKHGAYSKWLDDGTTRSLLEEYTESTTAELSRLRSPNRGICGYANRRGARLERLLSKVFPGHLEDELSAIRSVSSGSTSGAKMRSMILRGDWRKADRKFSSLTAWAPSSDSRPSTGANSTSP